MFKVKKQKGFTLVELIVVIAVLMFVVGTAVSIFFTIFQQQRRMLAEQELLNQVSFALEHMSKALRMAGRDTTGDCLQNPDDNYLLGGDNGNGYYLAIRFINQSENNICQRFYLDQNTGTIMEQKGDASPVALTSDRLLVNSIRFGLNGLDGSGTPRTSNVSDGRQPRVTIYLDIQTRGTGDQPSKKIQTTVSQRNINVQ